MKVEQKIKETLRYMFKFFDGFASNNKRKNIDGVVIHLTMGIIEI